MEIGLSSQINAMVHAMDTSTWGEKHYYISFVAPYQLFAILNVKIEKNGSCNGHFHIHVKIPLGGTTRNHLAKTTWKLDLILKNKIPSTYTLVYLIIIGGKCFPHLFTHSWKIMNTQKLIICINISISKPLLTQFLIFFLLNVLTFIH
jgi:hypothetical protein